MDSGKSLKFLCLIAILFSITEVTHAQTFRREYRIDYDNGLLSLYAEKANLKSLLTNSAEKACILIKFPHNLEKQTTINLSSVPLKKALRRLLKGENYALMYENRAITRVYVFPRSTGPRISNKYSGVKQDREERIRASIRRYENRLETLKKQMATVDEKSSRGRIITRQIRSTERSIERLQKSLER